jgi:hypothetical protein
VRRDAVPVAALRRKVEAWLREDGPHQAIALGARPEWTDEPVLTVGSKRVRVVACPTPLAARAALHDRTGDELLVLLTDLSNEDLGEGVLAHVSQCTVRSVNAWDLVRQMFGLDSLDPTLADKRFGGGPWLAAALTEFTPPEGWPPPPGRVLTRDHALRCLSGRVLGLDAEQIDSAGLLEWSTDAPAVLAFTRLRSPVVDGVSGYLAEAVGPAAVPVMAAVRAGHGVDAIPLGLLAAALWPDSAGPAGGSSGRSSGGKAGRSSGGEAVDVVVARTRLEPLFGGVRLTGVQARAFAEAAEAWVDRAVDARTPDEVRRVFGRAEALAAEIDATALLAGSELLPAGAAQRLRALAGALGPVVAGRADALPAVEAALVVLERHRFVEPGQRETARMAVRLARWLSTPDGDAPATLLDALHRQVREDAWVDRARLDLFAGATDREVSSAYQALYRAVDERRRRHDERFATLLAAAANAEPGAMLRVEDVLEKVVRPIVARRRVLVLVLDGMSTAACTELVEGVIRSGAWLELTPDGGPRTGVLAALPTVTEVSRCSLLSGRIATGGQKEESAALRERFPGSMLLHKAALRAGAGSAFDPEVVTAVEDVFVPLVVAVVNTIDDALDRGDPDTIVWSEETIHAVRDLLAFAQDRIVVLVSDHGHVIDRGPEAITRRSSSSENRWRPADPPPGDGEVLVGGSRVAPGGGRVVLPWREELRYGPRKSGYHGGASPAEAVIPLIVLSPGIEDAVPGWAPAPVASPAWWREPVPADAGPSPAAPRPSTNGRRRATPAPAQDTALFELVPETTGGPAVDASGRPGPTAARPPLVDALLASDVYAARRGFGGRALPDDRVAAMLTVLLAGGGRASMDTLAAQAGVPAHRISGTIAALRRVLQVEGYAVLELDPDGTTLKLDQELLVEQFRLEETV